MGWLLYAMAGLPALILALHAISALLPRRPSQLSAYLARLVSSIVALLLCASYGVVASIVLRLVGYGGLSQWTVARAFKWTMWVFTGVTFRVNDGGRIEGGRRGGEDALLTRPAVFVGNHQTELDVLLLGCVFPKYCSVTAKKSLRLVPVLGWFMALSKSVFIDRANRATARAAFDGAAKHMRSERQSVFIFPEGTRSYSETPELLPFKKGAFHLAIQAQVPIVPIVAANYSDVLNFKKRIFNAGIIDVSVLPAIPTTGLTAADADALTARTRDAMMNELIRLSYLGKENGAPLPRATGADLSREELRKRS
ncbi:acyltransferase-domain-containing protein [Lindgomyces ingoldianus]|uniref:Acyltransferase-domain-containing protein n=1 Tax=Lindgomyces ingoldianus TaxID=673940 RepID=A0ACB6QBA3_9PLEO|nr:acyltransferase-domain-containing protein [Lindgomyces ingoldianus]KAF2464324.1 acyltransferase-domain-containing protein [Lindgomyces ingoldianus]